MEISYLGPKGSFTEQALIKYCGNAKGKPCGSVREALDQLKADNCQKAIIPIENSTEGIVNSAMDAVIFDYDFYIVDMVVLPIVQNLLVKKGTEKNMIKTIISHAQGLAQCEKYLSINYKGVRQEASSSTSQAALCVSQSKGEMAAIASEINADIYALHILDSAIQDNTNNQTSFIVLSKKAKSLEENPAQSTLVFSTGHKPGDLYRILNIFDLWEINIIKIFSRPMKGKPGAYAFYLDIENSQPEDLKGALDMVKRKVSFFKYLGAYDLMDFTSKL